MLAKVRSSVLHGIDAKEVVVEVDVTYQGLPSFSIVGLPDTAVRESIKRVKKAITNSGFKFPDHKIVVNLAPAGIKKEGPSFDLPIALGIIAASEQLNSELLDSIFACGELSLDGKIKPLNGVLSRVSYMQNLGVKKCLIPFDNQIEAALVKNIQIIAAKDLCEAITILNNGLIPAAQISDLNKIFNDTPEYDIDFSEVKGHLHIKRGLEIAAAGGHNVLLIGPPGSGKTMLARRLETILPEMSFDEAIETTKIYSVAGDASDKNFIVRKRPFRSPHHSMSYSGLIGRSRPQAPGEVTLAHNGVLFMDEFPEFHRDILEMLRQPMEDGIVNISRSSGIISYPANFMLIAAMNPCPCGYFTHPKKECTCTAHMIQKYISKISGPLLDRIDMHLEVTPLSYKELSQNAISESSKDIKKRVLCARKVQRKRYCDKSYGVNALLAPKYIEKHCTLKEDAKDLLRMATLELNLSGRAYDKILKIARTIADLNNEPDIAIAHISEAINYRCLDKRTWSYL